MIVNNGSRTLYMYLNMLVYAKINESDGQGTCEEL